LTLYIRRCPSCGRDRPLTEAACESQVPDGDSCGFPLLEVMPTTAHTPEHRNDPAQAHEDSLDTSKADETHSGISGRTCRNGHAVAEGDALCLVCGETIADFDQAGKNISDRALRTIAGWQVLELVPSTSSEAEIFLARAEDSDERVILKYFQQGFEPQADTYRTLMGLQEAHAARLLEAGRADGRAFEVWEHLAGPSLADLAAELSNDDEDGALLRGIVAELIGALSTFESLGLRHGALQPSCVKVRSRSPLSLTLTDFETATLAEFDLEVARTRQASRYVAPETIVGASTSSSDYWSLGIIVLELLTRGACFSGVHERAFLLHLVTRGVHLPDNLVSDWRELLEGLLTRDPARRWRADQTQRWLDGERNIERFYEVRREEAPAARAITFAGQRFASAAAFALTAAEGVHWAAAKAMLESGAIASWIEQIMPGSTQLSQLRRIRSETRLPDDQRLSLSLIALNQDLPLCVQGELVTPNWLLANPERGGQWLDNAPIQILRELKRDDLNWLVRLAERSARVRAKAKDLRLALVEERFAVFRLSVSEALLEAQWRKKCVLFPDATAPGLSPLFNRRTHTDEDLLLLLCADDSAFRSAEHVLEEAQNLAEAASVAEFSKDEARALLAHPRPILQEMINERLSGFRRTSRPKIEEWRERYQIERRISLARMLVLLAIPASDWIEPPHQEYLSNVLDFLEKKVLAGVQRGPLIQLKISKSAAKIDMLELADAGACSTLLDAIVARRDAAPLVIQKSRLDQAVLRRLSRLDSQARTYRRDTGINALVLGFPILVAKDPRSDAESSLRIAPALLWPVKVTIERGATGAVRVGFDAEREVQLNPAFETILGSEIVERWRRIVDELLQSEITNWTELLFGELAMTSPTQCTRVPTAAEHTGADELQMVPAGAFFLADFPSQAVARDLRALRERALDRTALEVLFRLKEAPYPTESAHIPARDRFDTLEADPSQQRAILHARAEPGLLLQGPPGTGKSQTIVNIVADCLGRGETVMVVCEKQAALEVVHKRLAAEGLDHRICRVEDTTSDRKQLLEQLQRQVPETLAKNSAGSARRATERDALAARIDQIEAELNDYHDCIHRTHERLGYSYRDVLNQIAANTVESCGVAASGLRAIVGSLSAHDLEVVCGQCSGLAETWLDGEVEDSPLEAFRPFVADAALKERITNDFQAFSAAEAERTETLLTSAFADHDPIDVADANAVEEWLRVAAPELTTLDPHTLRDARQWRPFFDASSSHHAHATEQRALLDKLIEQLEDLTPVGAAALYADVATRLNEGDLAQACRIGRPFITETNLLARLNPLRPFARAAALKMLSKLDLSPNGVTAVALAQASQLELKRRGAAARLDALYVSLGAPAEPNGAPSDLIRSARTLARRLDAMDDLARCLNACPAKREAWTAAERGDPEALQLFRKRLRAAHNVAVAKSNSLAALEALAPWLDSGWRLARESQIVRRQPTRTDLKSIGEALPKLSAFQTFRLRSQDLSPAARAVFGALHIVADQLRTLEKPKRRSAVAALIRLEAGLAWKQEMEATSPKLIQTPEELEQHIQQLTDADVKMREANRAMLADVDPQGLGDAQAWSKIWAISGSSALRLRQVVEKGRALGLLRIRPIWLVNPDVVSRIFPLEATLFDVVVFDEASQMRVENAAPALMRARRAVVSGDDKQLPPTNFFGARIQSDEDGEDDEWLDAAEAEDAEVEAAQWRRHETRSNRRHIKDCEDLLALASGVLPDRSLDIHYRSAYRELIAFSNAAYYDNRLNVPVRRPPEEVMRAKPLDVRRIDGLYHAQTNPSEAAAVVDFLSEVWGAMSSPPTIGVVTFNLKQTELIQDLITERRDKDRTFARFYEREASRKAAGEDVGFFVRNLENVQGDERDWIVFSTTFGRNKNGTFARNFGALGQTGGERRLNVAVTRAKEKVVLMTSMPTSEISSASSGRHRPHRASEYLQAYMRYAEQINDGAFDAAAAQLAAFSSERSLEKQSSPAGADRLVADAFAALIDAGFKATLIDADDAFAVDIAVANNAGNAYCLGVEFDGPRHPLLNTARAREIWRPKLLARSGMQLHRVYSAAWVQDPKEQRRRLIEAADTALRGVA
jgi:primosomal replication protein N''